MSILAFGVQLEAEFTGRRFAGFPSSLESGTCELTVETFLAGNLVAIHPGQSVRSPCVSLT